MKKTNNSNTGIKKQLVSGAVYIALAVTVVAVTVSTITATFTEKDGYRNSGNSDDSIYRQNFELRLPDTNISGILPDAAVSDIEQGVEAKITDSEKPDGGKENKAGEAETEKQTEYDKNTSAVRESVPPDENAGDVTEKSEKQDDRTKPVSEEPSEETFETGYNGYIKPCSGYISKEFSVEVPVYSATMYDYRTHAGIDIACDIGTPVKAVTNGYILDVYDDYMFGKTVVIEHADGIHSVYSNLSPDLPAETVAGRSIMTGEIIGGVGDSALCESSEVSHLHFEMLKDGNYIDPEEFIN